MKIAVILPAAGAGRRFGNSPDKSKIEHELLGKAVFLRSAERFLQRPAVGPILLAVNPDRLDAFELRWGDKLRFLGIDLVPGGRVERWETVAAALKHVSDECTHVAVHDAARPLVGDALLDRIFEAAQHHEAVIPGLPVAETLKRVEEPEPAAESPEPDPLDAILGGAGKPETGSPLKRVIETVDRSDLVAVQTPQVFKRGLLQRGYDRIASGQLDPAKVTDDANLIEALGEPVYVVEGEPANLKLTRPEDLELMEAILAKRETTQAAEIGRKRLFPDDDED